MHPKYVSLVGFLVLATALGACAPVMASQTRRSQCNGPDSVSMRVDVSLSNLLLGTDSGYVAMRATLGITGVQLSQVALVSDPRVCARLATAIDHLEGVARPSRMVYAFSVGHTFAALDPNIKAGDYVQLLFYDTRYNLLMAMDVF